MDSNATYPDVMVVCDPLPGSYQTRPVLLAEVLSDSSTRRDRIDKYAAYTAQKTVASEGRSRSAGAQEPECMFK